MWWSRPRHSAETLARLEAAFPRALAADVRSVARILPESPYSVEVSHDDFATLIVCGETVRIPYRVYFPEPGVAATEKLTLRQRRILAALLMRSNDGYVRERRLREIARSADDWIVPFVVQLLSEYVIEIATVFDELGVPNQAAYVTFVGDNPEYWSRVRARMISYWAYYYRRRFPSFTDYPFYCAAVAIGVWSGHTPRTRRRH